MIGPAELRKLLPHSNAMCLLETVQDWDDTQIHCTATSHHAANNPLAEAGALAAINLVEYGGQAMAIHCGLLARRNGSGQQVCVLAGVRNVLLHDTRIDTFKAELHIRASRRYGSRAGWIYSFEAGAGQHPLAEGQLLVLPASSTG